jgi:hypothetical protein
MTMFEMTMFEMTKFEMTMFEMTKFEMMMFEMMMFEMTMLEMTMFEMTKFEMTMFEMTKFKMMMFEMTKFEMTKFEMTKFEMTMFEMMMFEMTKFEMTMFEMTNFEMTNFEKSIVTKWHVVLNFVTSNLKEILNFCHLAEIFQNLTKIYVNWFILDSLQDVVRISALDREIMMELLIDVTWTDCRVAKLSNETKIFFDLEKNRKPVFLPGIVSFTDLDLW